MSFWDENSLPGDADTFVQVDATTFELDPCGTDRGSIDVHFSDNIPYLPPDTLLDQCGKGCVVVLGIGFDIFAEGRGDTEVLADFRPCGFGCSRHSEITMGGVIRNIKLF